MDDPHFEDPLHPACMEVIREQVLHLSRMKGMEIKDSGDRNLHRLRL
jgi:hypothetical protein